MKYTGNNSCTNGKRYPTEIEYEIIKEQLIKHQSDMWCHSNALILDEWILLEAKIINGSCPNVLVCNLLWDMKEEILKLRTENKNLKATILTSIQDKNEPEVIK